MKSFGIVSVHFFGFFLTQSISSAHSRHYLPNQKFIWFLLAEYLTKLSIFHGQNRFSSDNFRIYLPPNLTANQLLFKTFLFQLGNLGNDF